MEDHKEYGVKDSERRKKKKKNNFDPRQTHNIHQLLFLSLLLHAESFNTVLCIASLKGFQYKWIEIGLGLWGDQKMGKRIRQDDPWSL